MLRMHRWSLACLWFTACAGSAPLEAPSAGASAEQEQAPPDDRPVLVEPVPSAEQPGDYGDDYYGDDYAEEPSPIARPPEDDGSCRAIVRRGEDVLLTFASGDEHLIDRAASWAKSHGQVWAIGEHAIVGVPESDEHTSWPQHASFALVHARNGVLWRGTAPAGDYTRATGFLSLTREGYVVLSDSRVVDPTGTEHDPVGDFLPINESIDEDGFIWWAARVSSHIGTCAPISSIVR
jgi:hypothetical protein